MVGFVSRRLAEGLITIVGASLVIFLIAHLSGDPVQLLLPLDAPPDAIEATRAALGLDKPVWEQYPIFLAHALGGDFGMSYRWQTPALDLILGRLPATIE